jgi:hypothetical protein
MVVVPDDTPRELQRSVLGYRALGDLEIAKDVLAWTRYESERRLHLRASFPSTIVREGKLLYAG